jgi:hypothetical protein
LTPSALLKSDYATLLKSTNNGRDSARPELAHARSFAGQQDASK